MAGNGPAHRSGPHRHEASCVADDHIAFGLAIELVDGDAEGCACPVQQLAAQWASRSGLHDRALRHMEKGRVVVIAGGTGKPYITTDTAAVNAALELGCDAVLKATKVDGIYDCDPIKHADAKRFTELSYLEVIAKQLQVMDATSITMCMEAKLPIMVFKLDEPGSVLAALLEPSRGTIVH